MKWRIPILTIGIMMLVASCKNKADGDNKTDTLGTTTTTTNEGLNPSVSTIEVPMTIKTTFEEKYPQATNVTWNYYSPEVPYYIEWDWTGWGPVDTLDYVVNYNWQGTDYMSWYDDQGVWVGTVANISDYTTLPVAVANTLNSQYNGYTITSVKMENDKDRAAYEISLEKEGTSAKLLVDENGKILKKKTKTGDTKTKEKMDPKN